MSETHEAHFFRGKTLLLTGASMGIGRALAVALARENARRAGVEVDITFCVADARTMAPP